MRRRIPDFIIGGAPRSGTTWLYHLLDRHPQVYMAKPVAPEPKYFLLDELYNKGFSYYFETWFKDAPENCVTGEKSTNYLEDSNVSGRIYKHLPGVKLIFILREPGARAYSNYLWSRMNGLEMEDFSTAIATERERLKKLPLKYSYSRPWDYFHRGLYAKHLRPFFDKFPPPNILCLKFEDIIHNASSLAGRIHQFLGVTPRPDDAMTIGEVNPSQKGEDESMSKEMRIFLDEAYTQPNKELASLLGPEFDVW